MKKILLCLITLVLFTIPLCAAAMDIQPADLNFTPVSGGKYIFCNNEEGLFRTTLADDTPSKPAYIMNNENLTPDRYILYLSHINYTALTSPDGMAMEKGFDVELDVQLKANQDSVLTINKTAFETPKDRRFFQAGLPQAKEAEWGCLTACADMLGEEIYQLHSGLVYQPKDQKSVTISIKAGQTVWLSQYIDNYAATHYMKPVHLAADLILESGEMDFNVAAFKSTGQLRDRSRFRPDSAFGVYKRDRMQKGIADSLPAVEANLEYTIDDTVADGAQFPVTVYNQYVPDGNTVTTWCTNLNPQDDPWSKQISAESDILTYRYTDDAKLDYYGKNVPQSERDNVWVFDTRHSDTKAYDGFQYTGYTADDYRPNYLLDLERNNYGFGCSMGNYGVAERYRISITNNGTRERCFRYQLYTGSNIIVALRDEDETLLAPVVSKGFTYEQTSDTMASVILPPGETTRFILETTLPINYVGGLKNTFELFSTPAALDIQQDKALPDIRIQNKQAPDYPALVSLQDQTVRSIFDANLDCYDIQQTDYGYAARWKVWDGQITMRQNFWGTISRVYFFDHSFRLAGYQDFPYPALDMSFARGSFYFKTTNGKQVSSPDGAKWSQISMPEGESLPLDNGGTFAAKMKDQSVQLSPDGKEYHPVSFQITKPAYLQKDQDLYYYVTGPTFSYSYDGIYWTSLNAAQPIESIMRDGSELVINETERFQLEEKEPSLYVMMDGEYLGFDRTPVLENDRTLVPMRYLFEKLNMDVTWDEETRIATATRGNTEIAFTIDSPVAWVNGQQVTMDTQPLQLNWRTMIPIRFLSETLGYTVGWDDQNRIVTIDNRGL